MASTIKRDDVKQKWEDSSSDTDFPLVCETCLGDNPYVRMTKEEYGKKCNVCDTPFTVYAWQAGTKGRLKKVEICKSCAKIKNVCQVCIYDLQYGLPVQVRDKILRENGGAVSAGGIASAVPQSQANRSWYTSQQERLLEQGQTNVGVGNELAHAKLKQMARMEPKYERNLPKLCSFYARGECDRGSTCPFRHEMPRDRNDPLSKQNTKDRFYGTNDPVASKMIAIKKQKEEERREKAKEANKRGEENYDERSKSTLYVRYSTRKGEELPPNLLPKLSESIVRDNFYSYGEIVNVRLHPNTGGAFVEYTSSDSTELAIVSMNRKLIHGKQIFVSWARAPKRGNNNNNNNNNNTNNSTTKSGVTIRPLMGPSTSTGPGGVGTERRPLPKGLKPIKPPPEVAAKIAAARSNNSSSNDPRPGGGVIRGVGINAARNVIKSTTTTTTNQQPYYKSADPNRLGTSSTSTK